MHWLRFFSNGDGTFRIGRTPRAFLAWECRDGGPNPLPKWGTLCEPEKVRFLIGATLREIEIQHLGG